MLPLILVLYLSPLSAGHALAAVVFIIASITDWLDGYLARRLGLTSDFGAFLDPVADKLLVSGVLLLLVSQHPGLLVPAVIIILREILVSALREWMSGKGKRDSVAVAFSGKLKTTAQMASMAAMLLVDAESPDWLYSAGLLGIYVAAALSLYSGWQYFRGAWSHLTGP